MSKFLILTLSLCTIATTVRSQIPQEKSEPSDSEPKFKTIECNQAEILSTECQTKKLRPIRQSNTLYTSQKPKKPVNHRKFLASEYYIAPRIASDEKISPFTTTIPLNNITISHLTNWEFQLNSAIGKNLEQDFGYTSIFKLNSQVKESLSRDNIFQTDQVGTYFQLHTVRNKRDRSTITARKENLLGLDLKMSLVGSCLFGEADPNQKCSYTPGLESDRDSIDPELLAPTKIFQTSNVGEVATPESLAVMQHPGFQPGADEQKLGVDLYFPNIGTISSEYNNNIKRKEEIELIPVGTLSRIRQVVKANGAEAVIGRTVKGLPLIIDSDRNLFNSAIAGVSFLLPDAIPSLPKSQDKFNPNVNQNLFLAANNARLPNDSYTIYHLGFGKAKSIAVNSSNTQEIPPAHFYGVWLGFSPVIDRQSNNSSYYEQNGDINIIADTGGEGGANSDVQMVSVVNEEQFSSNTLQNVYSQIYLKYFTQEADVLNVSSFKEKTNYSPHLSFSGNITKSRNILRYYTGAIVDDPFKAYLGVDYNHHTFNNWSFSAGGIGYLNPDREYYSQLWGNIGKKITINPQTQLTFFTNVNYAIDRPHNLQQIILSSRASSLTVGTRAKWQKISLGVNYNFDNLLPNSLEERLLINLAITLSARLNFSGYYTPINKNTSSSRYGANASLRLGKNYSDPTLSFGWENNEYRLGRGFTQSDNIFTLLFRMGKPDNPFNASTEEKPRKPEKTQK